MAKSEKRKRGVWLELTATYGVFNSEKTGEMEITMVSARCSECRSYSYNITQWMTRMTPFCPKCGAEMKGGGVE